MEFIFRNNHIQITPPMRFPADSWHDPHNPTTKIAHIFRRFHLLIDLISILG